MKNCWRSICSRTTNYTRGPAATTAGIWFHRNREKFRIELSDSEILKGDSRKLTPEDVL